MSRVPTAQDWIERPGESLAASQDIAKTTAAHGDPTARSVALGVGAQVLRTAAPIVGSALGGPLGALAAAAMAEVADSLHTQQSAAIDELTPEQHALMQRALDLAAAQLAKR